MSLFDSILEEQKPIEQQFLADLNHAIQTSQEERPVSKTYKPSSMGCLRLMYYQMVGAAVEAQSSDASNIGIGQSGTDRHLRIQQAIDELTKQDSSYKYYDIEEYVKQFNIPDIQIINKEGFETKCRHIHLNLSFMTDGIIAKDDKLYIFEYKTETDQKFQRRAQVDNDHITQVCCYALAFKINDALVLYENRNVCAKKAYSLHITEEMKRGRVVDRIQECNGYVERLITPKKTENKNCKYCGYAWLCKQEA